MKKEYNKLNKVLGRLIIGRIPGLELDEQTIELLKSGTMAGVTLFAENASNLKQLVNLIKGIKTHSAHPALVSVDQEGGAVQRFDKILTPLPAAMSLAAGASLERARKISQISAQQLFLCGINCNLAPTIDICSNPLNPVISTRSYGSSPELVRDFGLAVAESLQQEKLLAVGKHFPGHGDTLEDSHTDFAVNKSSSKTLWQRELVPFRAAVKTLPALLTAHIWVPAIDEQQIPASLSARVTSGLLREYLGFNRLVMTDDLMMKAVCDRWDIGEAAVMAILAGADQVLICGAPDQIISGHEALVRAVENGRISEARVQRSLHRIEQAMASIDSKPLDDVDSRLKLLQHSIDSNRQLSLDTALSGICILRGSCPTIVDGKWVVVAPDHPRYKLNLYAYLKTVIESKQLATEISEKRYSLDPGNDEVSLIADLCSGKNCIYMTYRTLLNKGQINLGRALRDATRKQVAIATDLPSDLIGLPSWNNCMASFDPSELSMEALSMVLAGQPARGTCPVSLQIEI